MNDAHGLDHLEREDTHTDPGVYAGRTLGGFRLFREIASGGMASVYLAYKAGPGGFGQTAAVKVVHPHLARDREFVEMFLDEARIAARISHPNVSRVFDFGRAEGTYYLAMEHLMGETWSEVLRTVLRRGVRSEVQHLPLMLASVLAQACEGLHAAHEAKDARGNPLNVVHRDVSPQNTFVTYDGGVRVLDFGIASAAERLHTTRNGAVKGRFSYMSPEQMRAEAVDRRSDIWSLGVILWEGLAQRRLFRRDTEAETILAVTMDPLPDIPRDAGWVPKPLVDIALKALQREPEDRYATAREMGAELARFVSRNGQMSTADISRHMHKLFEKNVAAKETLRAQAALEAEEDSDPAAIAALLPGDREPAPPAAEAPKVERKPPAEHHSVSVVRSTTPSAKTWHRPALAAAAAAVIVLITWALWSDSPEEATVQQSAAQPAAAPAAHDDAPTQKQAAAPAQEPAPAPEDEAEPAPAPEEEEEEPTAAAPAEPQETADDAQEAEQAEANADRERDAQRSRRRRRARERAEARRETGNGTLNVTTPGCWATVYAGRTKLGTSPGSFQLPAGVHRLRIALLGQKPGVSKRVHVRPGQTARIKVPCR